MHICIVRITKNLKLIKTAKVHDAVEPKSNSGARAPHYIRPVSASVCSFVRPSVRLFGLTS
jgi:hypothetical protein